MLHGLLWNINKSSINKCYGFLGTSVSLWGFFEGAGVWSLPDMLSCSLSISYMVLRFHIVVYSFILIKKKKKSHTWCTKLPLMWKSKRGYSRQHYPNLLERLILRLKPVTYHFWWKAITIVPRLNLFYSLILIISKI